MNNKLNTIIAFLCMLMCSIGASATVYEVSTASDFISHWKANDSIKLVADIDLSSFTEDDRVEDYTAELSGLKDDSLAYKISNLTQMMAYRLNGAKVHDLVFADCTPEWITNVSGDGTALLCRESTNCEFSFITLYNIKIDGTINWGFIEMDVISCNYASTFVCKDQGSTFADINAYKCRAYGSDSHVGILAGWAYLSTFKNCDIRYGCAVHADGSINGDEEGRAGGIVGAALSCTITGCKNMAQVTAAQDCVGGIAGYSSHTEFSKCYNYGTVKHTEEMEYDDFITLTDEVNTSITTDITSDELDKMTLKYGTMSLEVRNSILAKMFSDLKYAENFSLNRFEQDYDFWQRDVRSVKEMYDANPDAWAEEYHRVLSEEPKITEAKYAVKSATWEYCMFAYAVIMTAYQVCSTIYEAQGDDNVGGITGYMYHGNVSQCANYGFVQSADAYCGGIVGQVENSINNTPAAITDCINSGTVKGYEQSGGIVGSMSRGSISNCLNTGNISKGNSDESTFGRIYGELIDSGTSSKNYYSSNTLGDESDDCRAVTQQWLVDGQMTVTLNDNSSSRCWRQTLGIDHFPGFTITSDSLTTDSIQTDIDTTIRTQNASNLITGLCNQYSDIVLTGDISVNSSVFNLSSSYMPFYGSLDGQGHTISDVTYYLPTYNSSIGSNDNSNTYVALLPYATNATFKNLTLSNFNISNAMSSADYVAFLVGSATNCTFDSIRIANSGIAATSDGYGVRYVGAIASQTHDCTLTDCSVASDCTVRGYTFKFNETTRAGGLVSGAYDTKFLRCYNEGKLYADDDYAGGIVSYSEGSTLEACANTGSVEGEEYVGGIVGYAKNTKLLHCANSGTISCNSSFLGVDVDENEVGGLVGTLSGSSSSVTYCANWGNVDDGDGDYLVGTFDDDAPAVSSSANYYYCSLGGKTKSNVTKSEVLSGKTFYDINVAQDSISWYQDIDLSNSSLSGADSTLSTNYPVPIPAAGRVYSNILCDGTLSYSNIYKSTGAHTSEEDGYGLCSICGNVLSETVKDTVTVSNARELIAVANAVNRGADYSGAVVLLANDIDMSGFGYTPMGIDYDKPYKGTFDGQGYRIKNMSISTDQGGYGFFGHVAGGSTVIKNLIIDSSCSIESTGGGGTAGLIGCVQSDAGSTCNVYVINCGNEANVTGDQNTAGIIGGVYVNDNTHIYVYNTYNSGTISGNYESAAMCGYARCNYSFVNCYNSGEVTGVSSSTNYFYRNASSGTHLCTNCFDIHSGQTNVISTDDVKYGTLCQKLNENSGDYSSWTQDLSSDSHPTFGEGGLKYTRQASSQWGTIVLPFDVYVSDEDPYIFYQLSAVQDSTVTLSEISNKLSAGTPAIVYVDGSAKNLTTNKYELSLTADGDISTTINNPDSIGGLQLTGTFTAMDITEKDGYYLYDGQFCSMDSILNTGRDTVICCSPYTAYLGGTLTGNPQSLRMLSNIINISTGEELKALASSVNSGTDYSNAIVSLSNDIDMTGVNFAPIGKNKQYPFKGTFNGNGYRIKNLTLLGNTTGLGLFGCVAGGSTVIKNIIIDKSCYIKNSGTATAGLIGCFDSRSSTVSCIVSILNCGNEATIEGTQNTAGILGGIYGNDFSQLTMKNCYNSGTITGTKESATLCGYARKRFTISNCYNTGSLTGGEEGSLLFLYDPSYAHPHFQGVSYCYDINGAENCDPSGMWDGSALKLDTINVITGVICDSLNAHRGDLDAWTQDLGEDNSHPTFGDVGVKYTRTMTNQWGTIILPFNVEITDTASYDFYELSSVSNSTLTLSKVSGTLTAGTPAIIRMSNAALDEDTEKYNLSLIAKDRVSTKINTINAVDGLTLIGTYTSTDITEQAGYIISNNAFWNIASLVDGTTSKVYCSPFRAWLSGSISSGAKQLTIGFGEVLVSTAVDALDAVTSGTAEYYDINGRKLSDLQQGVNIVRFTNGQTRTVILK